MKKPTKSQIIFLITGIIVGFLVCLIFIPDSESDSNLVTESRDNDNGHKFINPLLECDNGAYISRDKSLNFLKKEIETIINQEISNKNISFASIYYRDLNNGPWLGVNEKEYFSPASLIKVPLMIAYFKQAENNPSILDEEIIDTEPYNPEEQNIKPEITIEPGKKYTVLNLIERMIIYSDNAAYQTLLHHIDNTLVFEVYKDLGVDISKAKNDPAGNIVTVKDYSSFFRILFNSSYLSEKYSEKSLEILSRTKFDQGLIKQLPSNLIVAHKFGEHQYATTNEKQLHDCGIVYKTDKPYLLCIMTRSNNFDKAAQVISNISSKIYTYISKN